MQFRNSGKGGKYTYILHCALTGELIFASKTPPRIIERIARGVSRNRFHLLHWQFSGDDGENILLQLKCLRRQGLCVSDAFYTLVKLDIFSTYI